MAIFFNSVIISLLLMSVFFDVGKPPDFFSIFIWSGNTDDGKKALAISLQQYIMNVRGLSFMVSN